MARGPSFSALRVWLYPLTILLGAALTIFTISVALDISLSGAPGKVLDLVLEPDPASAQNTLGNAGEIAASVLAIAITVVAIIVELASNRYTHRITELFVREPRNFLVMGFFVVTALQGLWVNLIIEPSGFVPYISIGVAMTMLSVSLLMLLPYFAYVFQFLNPINIVDRIRAQTLRSIRMQDRAKTLEAQQEAVRGLEQLADVATNAMEHKDKGVSMAGVDAMCSLLIDYQPLRKSLPDSWYGIDGRLAHNPDFVSMAPEVLEDLAQRRIWFEWKILRGYQSLYNEALNKMRDINYLVAIDTRLIAIAAWDRDNKELLALVITFFNTFLRSAINAHDIRTAYNVCNQYRLLAEEAIRREKGGHRAVEIARYFKYYGLLSFHANLPFLLETVAYDLCALCEFAFEQESSCTASLVRILLQVDKEGESESQETSLRGVRKAQLKLATYFLLHENESLAREVFYDMKEERPERLASIRDELLNVHTPEFWEVSDRGMNFDYVSGERKNCLLTFFEWFGDKLPAPRISREMTTSKVPVPADAGSPTPPAHPVR